MEMSKIKQGDVNNEVADDMEYDLSSPYIHVLSDDVTGKKFYFNELHDDIREAGSNKMYCASNDPYAKASLQKNLAQYIKQAQDKSLRISMHGGFLWVHRTLTDELTRDLTKSEKAKFMMICTYANGAGEIDVDIDDEAYGISRIIRTNEKSAKKLIDKMREQGVFDRSKNGKLLLPYCVRKGNMSKILKDFDDGYESFVRMYTTGIRRSYRDEASNHVLWYIIPLLKWLNYKYNALCHVAAEDEGEEVCPLTISKIAKIAGVNSTDLTSFKERLLTATFMTKQDGRQYIFAKPDYEVDGVPAGAVYLNPNLFFAGSLQDEELIRQMFVKSTEKD